MRIPPDERLTPSSPGISTRILSLSIFTGRRSDGVGIAAFPFFGDEEDLGLPPDTFDLFDEFFVSVTVSTYLVLRKVTTWGINLLYLYVGLTEIPHSIK